MIPIPPHVALERASGWLVAFDPGLRYPAAAVFDRGLLIAASRIPVPGKLAQEDIGERARVIAELTFAWVIARTGGAVPKTLVVERPKVYPAGRSKGDPQDLIDISFVGGAVIGKLSAPGITAVAPLPSDWIGGIPKETKAGNCWTSPRGLLAARRLTALERLAVVDSHDAVDAALQGKWALGGLGHVFSST